LGFLDRDGASQQYGAPTNHLNPPPSPAPQAYHLPGPGQYPGLPPPANSVSPRDLDYSKICREIHRVVCSSHAHQELFFEDRPERSLKWTERNADGFQHLAGKRPIDHLSQWIFNAGDIAFVIFKEYRCRDRILWNPRHRMVSRPMDAHAFRESIALSSDLLQRAVTEVSKCAPNDGAYEVPRNPNEPGTYYNSKKDDEIETYPPRFFYHHRALLSDYANSLGGLTQYQTTALLSYVQASQGAVFDQADGWIAQGKVHRSHLEMLFCPNDIVIAKMAGHLVAHVLRAWPQGESTIFLDCWAWGFDGNWLHRKSNTLTILRPPREFTIIRDLEVFPIRFATQEELEMLRIRGQKFWGLRYQSLVTYNGWDTKAEQFYVCYSL
jgi:hypothetical protein